MDPNFNIWMDPNLRKSDYRHHLEYLNAVIMELVAPGSYKRLGVSMPPQFAKSTMIARALIIYYLGLYPSHDVIIVSHNDDLASDHSVAVRNWFQEHGKKWFGQSVRSDSEARSRWVLTPGKGSVRSYGIMGSITGHPCNLLVVDDPFKNVSQAISLSYSEGVWDQFLTAVNTRLHPDGRLVVDHTRWAPTDLLGRIKANESPSDPFKFHYVEFPLYALSNDKLGRPEGQILWPEKYNLAWCESVKSHFERSAKTHLFEALYQQQPVAHLQGREWPPELFPESIYFTEWPQDPYLTIAAVDPSLGVHDYSCICLIKVTKDGTLWVKFDLERRGVEKLEQDILSMTRNFHLDGIVFESNGFQKVVADRVESRLQKLQDLVPVFKFNQSTGGGKLKPRIRLLDPLIRNGKLKFFSDSKTRLGVAQVMEYSMGEFDDAPDSLQLGTQLLRQLKTGSKQPQKRQLILGR